MYSKEHSFISIAINDPITGEDAGIIKELLQTDLDWGYIGELASMHHIYPLIYGNLRKHSLDHHLPAKIQSRLKTIYHTNYFRTENYFKELKKLLPLFEQNGVDCLAIQGIAIAAMVYEDIAVRPLSDIDLLIRLADFEKAKEVFNDNGYAVFDKVYKDKTKFETGVTFKKKRSDQNEMDVFIEIHFWENVEEDVMARAFKIDYKGVWERKKFIETPHFNGYILHPIDFLIFHALHTVVSHELGRLIWYLDYIKLFHYFRNDLDSQELVKAIKKTKTQKICHAMLEQSRKYFNARFPDDFEAGVYRFKGPFHSIWYREFAQPSNMLTQACFNRNKTSKIKRFINKIILTMVFIDSFFDLWKTLLSFVFPGATWKAYAYRKQSRIKKKVLSAIHPLTILLCIFVIESIVIFGGFGLLLKKRRD